MRKAVCAAAAAVVAAAAAAVADAAVAAAAVAAAAVVVEEEEVVGLKLVVACTVFQSCSRSLEELTQVQGGGALETDRFLLHLLLLHLHPFLFHYHHLLHLHLFLFQRIQYAVAVREVQSQVMTFDASQ